MISGITIHIQTTGSAHIIPQYAKTGANTNAKISFPASSIKLEITGVIRFPNPCMELRRITIIEQISMKHISIFRYVAPHYRISGSEVLAIK